MAEPTKNPPRKRKTAEELMAILKKKQEQAAQRLANLNAKIGKSERRRDALRKIYVGGLMIATARSEDKFARWLLDKLKKATLNERESEALAPLIAELEAILRAAKSGGKGEAENGNG